FIPLNKLLATSGEVKIIGKKLVNKSESYCTICLNERRLNFGLLLLLYKFSTDKLLLRCSKSLDLSICFENQKSLIYFNCSLSTLFNVVSNSICSLSFVGKSIFADES